MKKSKYWFKPRMYGWGVYPVSWEGWFATLILFVLVMLISYAHGMGIEEISPREKTSFVLDVAILIVVAIVYFRPKTKGRIRWRWGRWRS